MTLTQSTLAKIRNLVDGITDTTVNDDFVWQIPVPNTAINEDAPCRLFFDKKEALLFSRALRSLEADTAVEHLPREDLDRELLNLVRDVREIKRGVNPKPALRLRVQELDSELARPLMTYEVVLSVEGIEFPVEPLTFGGVAFQAFGPELEAQWGFASRVNSGFIAEWHRRRVGRAVGIVTVQAGSDEKAKERAARSFDRALNILRVCIASSVSARIWDEQLLQRRGPFFVIRRIDPDEELQRVGWEARVGCLETTLELRGTLMDGTRKFLDRLGPLYGDMMADGLREALLRSLEWIGMSITREQYDHKIIDLCIALESVLATVDDPRKGEAIALRLMLLAMTLDTSFGHPRDVFHLYGLRSRVVHGSAQGVCSRSDYFRLREIAEEAVLRIIELNLAQGPIIKPRRFIEALETRELLEKTINWLENWQDASTKKVYKYAKLRFEEKWPIRHVNPGEVIRCD